MVSAHINRSGRGTLKRQVVASVLSAGMFVGIAAQSTASAETRDFVVRWFMQAANAAKGDTDCPEGLNALPEEMFRRQLLANKFSEAQVDELMAGLNGGSSSAEVREALIYRGRGEDGQLVHSYSYPTSVPDLGLMKQNKGPSAYGFNLDGKVKPGDYTDPDTKETGVDNAFWRATGCSIGHRGTRTEQPSHGTLHWDILRDKQPAWIIRVTANDFSKDGEVEVLFTRAMERISRDANGDVRRYSTFRVDPDTRWQNKLKGQIKNGVVNVSIKQMNLLGDPYVLTNLEMSDAHFRIRFNQDESIEGVLGGYLPWRTIFYEYGSSGYSSETMIGANLPATYYALKNAADAKPDPKTKENTAISAAYRVVAVPAFILTEDEEMKLSSSK